MGNELGEKYFQLLEQFHHCIFFGDLNYRTVEMNAATALSYIARGQLESFRWHDGLLDDLRNEMVFYHFQEPVPRSDFYPTYKKYEDRPGKCFLRVLCVCV